MRFVLTQEERELIALRRAFLEYATERTRKDFTLEDERAHMEDMCSIELDADGSGCLWVLPGDYELSKFRAVGPWTDMAAGTEAVKAATRAILDAREARQALITRRPPGDPRKGRKRPPAVL